MHNRTHRFQPEVQGLLLVDKPLEWTSHDVVNFVRRRFRVKKVGHGGTLDPIATGLLVLFIGQATKQVKNFEHDDKEYIATMAFGCDTFSNDGTGEVLKRYPLDYISLKTLQETFNGFIGDIMQAPPQVSAVKVDGQRLYKMARQGQSVEPEPRLRTIHELQILHYSFPYIIFRMACSKGTYVRKLCADIGAKLGCGAYMSSLIRTRSGSFNLRDAVTIDQLRETDRKDFKNYLIPLSAAANILKQRAVP